MKDKTITDNEIIKALECCSNYNDCDKCNFEPKDNKKKTIGCCLEIMKNALDTITRQQAEIESLKADKIIAERHEKDARELYKDVVIQLKTAKSEAVKEFAEKIYTEINEALAQNHKVKVERINKLIARGIKSNDEFCYEIDGKILALRGISEFIDNLLKRIGG